MRCFKLTNILLVCSAGMSTSLMVKKMEAEAEAQGKEVTIWAVPDAQAKDNIGKADVMLLGPQIRFMQSKMEGIADGKPVAVIDMRSYAMMDGKAVLQQAFDLLD